MRAGCGVAAVANESGVHGMPSLSVAAMRAEATGSAVSVAVVAARPTRGCESFSLCGAEHLLVERGEPRVGVTGGGETVTAVVRSGGADAELRVEWRSSNATPTGATP